MPEISPTMYPFIIAGGGAIVLLLLLVLIVRRRRASRAALQDEADTSFPGADEEPAGVKLVSHEESPEPADESPDEGRPVGGPGDGQPVGAPPAARSEHLVAWGPDEAGGEGGSGSGTEAGATSASELPPGQSGEAPEGQPFKWNGQWWFRRDGELLVYDDDNSEWKAAPQSSSPAPAGGAPGDTGDPESQGEAQPGAATTTTLEREEPVEQEATLRPRPEGATSWKCQTCGATNGSAAEGCRLCFTPRA